MSIGHQTCSSNQLATGTLQLTTCSWRVQVFVREVGKGSIGRVHLGHWRETSVAIKSLTPVLEAGVRKRLSTENRSLSSNQAAEPPDAAASGPLVRPPA